MNLKGYKFADHVCGINERIQAKIEILDDVWESYWSLAKRVLIVAALVFAFCSISVLLKWESALVQDVAKIGFPTSLSICFCGYFASAWTFECLRHQVGVMLGTGVVKVIHKPQTTP